MFLMYDKSDIPTLSLPRMMMYDEMLHHYVPRSIMMYDEMPRSIMMYDDVYDVDLPAFFSLRSHDVNQSV